MSIPLRHRLPNPSPIFSGRKVEVNQLARAVRRGSLTLVYGIGGIGKSALAAYTLRHRLATWVDKTIHMRASEDLAVTLAELLRVLCEASGVSMDWAGLSRDSDFIIGTAIDLADRGPWCVLIEDYHRLDDAQGEHFLEAIHRYARQSRWVVTTRRAPRAHYDGQSLALGPLESDALGKIVDTWHRGLKADRREELIRISSGSPWILKQLLAGASPVGLIALEEFDAAGQRVLTLMSRLERPVPANLLHEMVPALGDEGLEQLVRRSLIVHERGGYHLHAVARECLAAESLDMESVDDALLVAMQPHEELPVVLERMRLASRDGDHFTEFLSTHGATLLDNAFGPEISAALTRRPERNFDLWRLRVAVNMGDHAALMGLSVPVLDRGETCLLWGLALYEMSQFPRAVSVFERAAELLATEGQERKRVQARVYQARSMGADRRVSEAVLLLEGLESDDEAALGDARLTLADSLAMGGEDERCRLMLPGCESYYRTLEGSERMRAAISLCRIYYYLRDLHRASALLEAVMEEFGSHLLAISNGKKALQVQIAIGASLGLVGQTRASIALLSRASNDPHTGLRLRLSESNMRLIAGDLEGLEYSLRSLISEAESARYGDAIFSAKDLLVQLHMLRGLSCSDVDWTSAASGGCDLKAESLAFEEQLAAREMLWQMRHRGTWSGAIEREWTAAEFPRGFSAVLTLAKVQHQLNEGRFADADRLVLKNLGELRSAGDVGDLAETLVVACSLYAAVDDRRALAVLAQELESLASRMPSKRFTLESRFYAKLSHDQGLALADLEWFATCFDTAPRAARRSAAALGEEVPLDALDEPVIAELSRRLGPMELRILGDSPGPVSWGIDVPSQGIWFPNGESISLQNSPQLWLVLETLVDGDGAASKEQLAERAWNERQYHPLKHDNRLRVAVRRLRVLCEPHSSDLLLEANDDGYRLCGTVRVRLCQEDKVVTH